MVTEMIITLFFGLFTFVISLLPVVDVTLPENPVVMSTFDTVVQSASYFLPVAGLLPLFLMTFALDVFHLAWKIFLRAKSFIPTMGA